MDEVTWTLKVIHPPHLGSQNQRTKPKKTLNKEETQPSQMEKRYMQVHLLSIHVRVMPLYKCVVD